MAFKKYPIEFKTRSSLEKDGSSVRVVLRDTKLLVRYTKVEGDPTDPPELVAVLRDGRDQMDIKWWEVKDLGTDGDTRLFGVIFYGQKFSATFRPSTQTCSEDRLLYEAFLDQSLIVLKLNMGVVPLGEDDTHCKKADHHVASLYLSVGHHPE